MKELTEVGNIVKEGKSKNNNMDSQIDPDKRRNLKIRLEEHNPSSTNEVYVIMCPYV